MAGAFADFARRVAADADLAAALRPICDAPAFVAASCAAAERLGFAVVPGEVEAAMAGNRLGWLVQTTPLARPGEPGPIENADPRALDGWTPFRTGWADGTLTLDWFHLGARRFTEPFFYETVSGAIGHPFNAAFQQRSRADDLARRSPGLAPTGFVFHMARCGSTLCAQALAADPGAIVLSEAWPIRGALEAARVDGVSAAQADAWLAGVIGALTRPRFPQERRAFVKFMAADVLDLPRIQRVFPDVPWIFLYRDPLEILASQRRRGGADTPPGATDQLHAIAAYGRAALAGLARAPGRGLVIRYDGLASALACRIPRHFGLAPDARHRAALDAVLQRDAKAPGRAFAPDGADKRIAAEPYRVAANAITGPVLAALDAAQPDGL